MARSLQGSVFCLFVLLKLNNNKQLKQTNEKQTTNNNNTNKQTNFSGIQVSVGQSVTRGQFLGTASACW